MKRLTGENIISCYADGTIRPEGTVTKAELAAMLLKMNVGEKAEDLQPFDAESFAKALFEL